MTRVALCPLCDDEHAGCRFAAGSLYCVAEDCANPHHRQAAVDAPTEQVIAIMLDAALRYARGGWPVFPCRPGAKAPLFPRAHDGGSTCRGECGRLGHGLYDAVTDEVIITAWWTRHPTANVAIATGHPGPDVVDVDVKGDSPGADSFDRIRRAGLVRGSFAVVETPSGGWHCYFTGTDQGNGSVKLRGIDFRGKGGYVLAPPSQVDGRTYVLAEHRDYTGVTVDFAAIRAHLDPPQSAAARNIDWDASAPLTDRRIEGLVRHVASQREGNHNRNNALHWASCRAVEADADEDVFRALARAAISAGLTVRETSRTIESARSKAGAR